MKILKSKKFYIILVVIILIGGSIAYGKYKKANQPVEYETVDVSKGDVARTVEATGKVQSVNDLSLRFETAGTVASVAVNEGQTVKAGAVLANLNLSSLDAAVAQAKANLDQQLAGSTEQELNSLKAAQENAKAALDKAKTDAAISVAAVESAMKTAKNNMKLAEGGSNSQIVTSEYRSAVALLQSTISVLDDALVQADNILGVDNTSANDAIEPYLAGSKISTLNTAVNYYPLAKKSLKSASNLVLPLTTISLQSSIDNGLNETEIA